MIAQTASVFAFAIYAIYTLLDVILLGQLSAWFVRPTTSMYFSRLGITGGAAPAPALRCVNGDKDYDVCGMYPVEMVECHATQPEHWECTPHWYNTKLANDLVFRNEGITCPNMKHLGTCFITYTLRYNENAAKHARLLNDMRFFIEVALTFASILCVLIMAYLGISVATGSATFCEDSEKLVLTIQKFPCAGAPPCAEKKEAVVAEPTKKEESKAAEPSTAANTTMKE